jgi:hypothetical protein
LERENDVAQLSTRLLDTANLMQFASRMYDNPDRRRSLERDACNRFWAVVGMAGRLAPSGPPNNHI